MKQPKTSKLAFLVKENRIYEKEFTFNFYGGFALSQKQKTIEAFHQEIHKEGITDIVEISRKSKNPIGNALSAFNLLLTINNTSYPIECVYQSSKVFNHKIQFTEALQLSPIEAKRIVKSNVESKKLILTGFKCFGIDFPILPKTVFYDYIYVLALSQHPSIASEVVKYYCYTDVEFNHKKQLASQARSCAIFKYLADNHIVKETLENLSKFVEIYDNIIQPIKLELKFT